MMHWFLEGEEVSDWAMDWGTGYTNLFGTYKSAHARFPYSHLWQFEMKNSGFAVPGQGAIETSSHHDKIYSMR